MSEENKPKDLSGKMADAFERNKREGFRIQKIIGGLFLIFGLFCLGILYEGISSITVLICLLAGAFLYERKYWNKRIRLLIIVFTLLAPLAAFIDLRGNFIYNKPVEKMLCQPAEEFKIDVVRTVTSRSRIRYSLKFSCVSEHGELQEVSGFYIFGIRVIEYIFIGLIVALIFRIGSKLLIKRGLPPPA